MRKRAIGILDDKDHRDKFVIPTGSIFTVIEGPTDGDRLIDIFWQGRRLLMFAQDFRLRAERLSDAEGKVCWFSVKWRAGALR